ncbi:MAG: hypothetical protein ACI9WU_001776 [Myxococcota bacterium]|jgi:hypothetical protein
MSERITIRETTVAEVSGIRVGLGNVWDEDYDNAAGETVRGVRGTLAVMGEDPDNDFDQRVAVGDTIRIQGQTWAIVAAVEPESDLGHVTLECVVLQ